ncbi:hypothetical protein WJX77_001899 [Trebouxia sp. C0004]
MARATATTALLVLVSLTWRAEALPRIQALNSLRDAFTTHAELIDANELALPEPTQYKNPKPLIGILSQACHYCPGKSYVAAAYVKWIESAGGRAVPIRFYESEDEIHRLFRSINGVILPGGLTDLWLDDPYVLAAKKLLQWATEENKAGEVFPVWGTCLGHQLQMILTANVDFNDLLITTDAVAHPSTLNFYGESNYSRLFKEMNPELKAKLSDKRYNIAMENHEFGVAPEAFTKWIVLNDTYDILSTSIDRNGAEYISTIEHIMYPFFGTQWHPEKPPYEFSLDNIPHSRDAVHVSQHLADVFVDYARHSSHKPESKEEELAMLIYNYEAYFTARDIVMEPSYDGPDITYFFDPQEDVDPRQPGVKMGVLA